MSSSNLPPKETWASGAAYEAYVGRWSRFVAREFLRWLGVPAGRQWLDVGCGTGGLTQTILDSAAPGRVDGIDRSQAHVAFAREKIPAPRARFAAGDAQALPVGSARYDAVVSGLVLNFVAEPGRMAAEMARAAKPGGVVAVYVWDYAGHMQLMRIFWDAAVALDPAAAEFDEGWRFPICRPVPLRELFERTGLGHVDVRPLEILTRFQDFDDYWTPFLGGQGPAPGYARSLSDERRAALRDRIRARLAIAPDGSISLMARAWAVRGMRDPV